MFKLCLRNVGNSRWWGSLTKINIPRNFSQNVTNRFSAHQIFIFCFNWARKWTDCNRTLVYSILALSFTFTFKQVVFLYTRNVITASAKFSFLLLEWLKVFVENLFWSIHVQYKQLRGRFERNKFRICKKNISNMFLSSLFFSIKMVSKTDLKDIFPT